MAKDAAIKGGGEVEALDYGMQLRSKGYGEEVEILADIIKYGEANPDSEVNAILSKLAEDTDVDKTGISAIMKNVVIVELSAKKYPEATHNRCSQRRISGNFNNIKKRKKQTQD